MRHPVRRALDATLAVRGRIRGAARSGRGAVPREADRTGARARVHAFGAGGGCGDGGERWVGESGVWERGGAEAGGGGVGGEDRGVPCARACGD